MDGDLSGFHVDHGPRSGPSHRRLPLVGISGEGGTDLGQPLLIDHRRPLKSRLQDRLGFGRSAGFPLPLRPRGHGGEGGLTSAPSLGEEMGVHRKEEPRVSTVSNDGKAALATSGYQA